MMCIVLDPPTSVCSYSANISNNNNWRACFYGLDVRYNTRSKTTNRPY